MTFQGRVKVVVIPSSILVARIFGLIAMEASIETGVIVSPCAEFVGITLVRPPFRRELGGRGGGFGIGSSVGMMIDRLLTWF